MKKELGLMSVLFCLTPALIAQNKGWIQVINATPMFSFNF